VCVITKLTLQPYVSERERERESVCVCVRGWEEDGCMMDGCKMESTHTHTDTQTQDTHTLTMHTWAQGGTAKSKVHMTWPDMIG
jgi:hypothetical protein